MKIQSERFNVFPFAHICLSFSMKHHIVTLHDFTYLSCLSLSLSLVTFNVHMNVFFAFSLLGFDFLIASVEVEKTQKNIEWESLTLFFLNFEDNLSNFMIGCWR